MNWLTMITIITVTINNKNQILALTNGYRKSLTLASLIPHIWYIWYENNFTFCFSVVSINSKQINTSKGPHPYSPCRVFPAGGWERSTHLQRFIPWGTDWGYAFPTSPEIFKFVTLPLEIPKKTSFHSRKFCKIVWHSLGISR